jgi:hypothetical protein
MYLQTEVKSSCLNALQSKLNMKYLVYMNKKDKVNLLLVWVWQPLKVQHAKHQSMK